MNRDELAVEVRSVAGEGMTMTAAESVVDRLLPLIEADVRKRVLADLREFLPEWNYPPHVVSAICLELKARGAPDLMEPLLASLGLDAPNPDCAARNRPHSPHTLESPGGNKPGSRCAGLTEPAADQ